MRPLAPAQILPLHHPSSIVETDDIGEGTRVWAWAHISRDVTIGDHCTVGEGVYIGPGVKIGNRCKIQNHSLIYSGVTIEDEVFIGPNVITTNDRFPKAVGEWTLVPTLIKRGASICANTTIVCGVVIGENAMIGAGSLVTQDIKAGWMAYGNPAHHVRKCSPLPI